MPTASSDHLIRGAYAKGTAWKWGVRLAAGSLAWLILLTLVGAFGSGLVFFVLGAMLFMPMTAKAGLVRDPHTLRTANPPIFGGILGMSYRIQDTIGDWMMTPIWNLIRQNVDTRFD